jgi:hypothetical protein
MVAERDSKTIVYLVVAVVVSISLLTLGFYYLVVQKGVFSQTIPAMEVKTIADNLAKSWNSDATLINVRPQFRATNDGLSTSWYFDYCNNKEIQQATKYIEVIAEKGSVEYYGERSMQTGAVSFPVNGWNIDSDEAVNAAKTDEFISEYFSKYQPVIDRMDLFGKNNMSSYWSISWNDVSMASADENYHSAYAIVDATTGEIIQTDDLQIFLP